MVGYSRDEIVGITELKNSLGRYIDQLSSKTINRLVIFRRSKPEAVIISIKEYESLKEAAYKLEDMEIRR